MATEKKPFIIRNPKYFKALTSAQRIEIISSLGDAGPASIAELAARLGRTPHSLYHHMETLTEAGIVRAVREGKKKKEAIYSLTSEKILLDPDRKSPAALLAAKKSIDSALRVTSREVYEALSSDVKRDGQNRELYAVRLKGRFLPATLKSVNKHLQKIEEILRKQGRSSEGKLFALTIVLTPCRISS
jgi:DNA-binding transcriptional ArsR family regulator